MGSFRFSAHCMFTRVYCRFVNACLEVLKENDIVEVKHLNGVEADGLVFDAKLSGGCIFHLNITAGALIF